MTVFEIVAEVCKRLDLIGIPYAVGGSVASSAWGQMRNTNDADIVVRLRSEDAYKLLSAFPEPYFLSEEEVLSALASLEEFRPVQLLHMEEAFKVDLFLLRDGAYERTEIERAREVEIIPDAFIRFYAPENIVIAKLRWYVAGRRVSDRQWNDIIQVLEIQKGYLDDAYLDEWASRFGVLDLLQEARRQVTR